MTEMQPYFSGEQLYGDDFDQDKIDAWFADEREGYANLTTAEVRTSTSDEQGHRYGYHELNKIHGFRHLPAAKFVHALGIGSAYGTEFMPIIDRIEKITILEPSAQLRSRGLAGVPLTYVDPAPSGDMPFDDATFDLVLSLGVLHHIPNVSHVISEIGRVIAPGGYALVREPIISMGDWRRPRPGLTAHERGIPSPLLLRAINDAGFDVIRQTLCSFPTTGRLARHGWGFDTAKGVLLDTFLCRMMSWNWRYHATASWHKLRPTSGFYVLRKK